MNFTHLLNTVRLLRPNIGKLVIESQRDFLEVELNPGSVVLKCLLSNRPKKVAFRKRAQWAIFLLAEK